MSCMFVCEMVRFLLCWHASQHWNLFLLINLNWQTEKTKVHQHFFPYLKILRVVLLQSKELMVTVYYATWKHYITTVIDRRKKKKKKWFRSRGFLPNIGQVLSAFSFPAQDNGSFKSLTLKANETHSSSEVMSDVGGRSREGRGWRGIIIRGQQKQAVQTGPDIRWRVAVKSASCCQVVIKQWPAETFNWK